MKLSVPAHKFLLLAMVAIRNIGNGVGLHNSFWRTEISIDPAKSKKSRKRCGRANVDLYRVDLLHYHTLMQG